MSNSPKYSIDPDGIGCAMLLLAILFLSGFGVTVVLLVGMVGDLFGWWDMS